MSQNNEAVYPVCGAYLNEEAQDDKSNDGEGWFKTEDTVRDKTVVEETIRELQKFFCDK